MSGNAIQLAVLIFVASLATAPAAVAQITTHGYDSDHDYPGQGDDWYGRRDGPQMRRDYAAFFIDEVLSGDDFCHGYDPGFDSMGFGAPLFRTNRDTTEHALRFSIADPAFGCVVSNPCEDGNPCTVDTFDSAQQLCVNTPRADGSSCSNGIFCDGAETCSSGVCWPGTPPSCDDGSDCTNDYCDPASDMCVHFVLFEPAEVTGMSVGTSAPGSPQAMLNWPALADADTYNVYRSPDGGMESMTCFQSGLDETTTVDDGMLPPPGEMHAFLVTGANACGGEGTMGDEYPPAERINPMVCP